MLEIYLIVTIHIGDNYKEIVEDINPIKDNVYLINIKKAYESFISISDIIPYHLTISMINAADTSAVLSI